MAKKIKAEPKKVTLTERVIELVNLEMKVLSDYSMRNLGVSQPQAATACDVITTLMRQLQTYDYNTSELQQQYRAMRKQCKESWGKSYI